MPPPASDKQFAEAAVKLGIIKEKQLHECLLIQTTMRNLGVEEAILRIMEKKGYITSGHVASINKHLGIDTGPIPGYSILSKIGTGGTGVVYKAKQTSVDRIVALKILNTQTAADKQFIKRFLQEGCAAAKLSHRNIVSVYDAGVAGPYYFMIMEFIQGQTLREILNKTGPLSEKKSVELILQITEALCYLKDNHLVHRDIKPENIMLTREGIAKLCDFGLAKFVQSEQSLTQSGCIMGTPLYMSPEQIRGDKDIDIRSDVYSLGVTLYTMASGRPPFEGKTPVATMQMHLNERPQDPRERGQSMSQDLWLILQKMLEKDPGQRYPSPQALATDLKQFLVGFQATLARHHAAVKEKRRREMTPVSKTPRRVWWVLSAVAAAASIVLAAAGYAVSSKRAPISAEALKLLHTADEDFQAMRLTIAKERYEELLKKFGTHRPVVEQVDQIARRVAFCENEIQKAAEEIQQDLERGAQFEEQGDWESAVACYQALVDKSRALGLPAPESFLMRSRDERDASGVIASLKKAAVQKQWTTALSLAKYVEQHFGSTRTMARNAKLVMEIVDLAERELAAPVVSKPSEQVLWEEGFDNGFKNWKAESARTPTPRAEPAAEPHDGPTSCRLIYTGPGGTFHRLVLPVPGLDVEGEALTFWAKGNETATMLLFIRESSDAGTEQFVKEFTISTEWQFYSIPLASLRRTWGTHQADGRLQKNNVREMGFEPAATDRSVHMLVDTIRLTRPGS